MMWMNSRFATWEVEGEVWERVNGALHTMEQERLARAVQRAEAKRAPAGVLSTIYAGLERLGRRTFRRRAGAHT